MRQELLDKKKKLLMSLCLTFFIATICIGGWFFLFNNKVFVKKYNQEYFTLNYDDTWSTTKKENNSLTLTHPTNSIIDIKVNKLSSKNRKSDIELIKEEVRYDIEKQNLDYVLIKEEKTAISEEKYDAYKLLYETKDSQNLTIIMKNDTYLCIINYTSNNKYFDILLDSVQLVIGTIRLK